MGYAAAPTGQGLVGQAAAAAGGTVYVPAAKRRKTAEEKAAAAEERRRLQEEAQAQWASGQPFSLNVRAPWAEKEVAMPELTDEQKAYIQVAAEFDCFFSPLDTAHSKRPWALCWAVCHTAVCSSAPVSAALQCSTAQQQRPMLAPFWLGPARLRRFDPSWSV